MTGKVGSFTMELQKVTSNTGILGDDKWTVSSVENLHLIFSKLYGDLYGNTCDVNLT